MLESASSLNRSKRFVGAQKKPSPNHPGHEEICYVGFKNTVLHHDQAVHETLIIIGYYAKEAGKQMEYKVRKATLAIYCCVLFLVSCEAPNLLQSLPCFLPFSS
jgi:hypothetical protein